MPANDAHILPSKIENLAHLLREQYVPGKGKHAIRLKISIRKLHEKIGPGTEFSKTLDELGISVSGIHYMCPTWVPVLLNISDEQEEHYVSIIDGLGVNNHLAMAQNPYEFIIEVPHSFFKSCCAEALSKVLRIHKQHNNVEKLISKITAIQVESSEYKTWKTYSPNGITIEQILGINQNSLPLVVATSCFRTLTSEASPVFIYHHPKLGGVATVSSSTKGKNRLRRYFDISQRLLYLISLVDGYLQAYDKAYAHYLLDDTTKGAFRKALVDYVQSIQRPEKLLENYLTVDTHMPISVVKRYGNKSTTASWQIVARLAVLNRDAYIFLHADGAVVLSRIEEFLNGWIQGYMSSGDRTVTILKSKNQVVAKPDKHLSVSVDVYVAPDVEAMEARNVNLYSPHKLTVDIGSNMSLWYQLVSSSHIPKTEVPAVIYRFSETVGPSIFIGEIAAALSRHYLNCEHCTANRPLSILNLFSGSLSCECTVKTRLQGCSANGIPITFLSIDRNPYPLELEDPDIRKGVHVVAADVFELSEHMSRSSSPLKEPNDVYASGYDLVIADPPHYLTFDYLCQPITWPIKGSGQGMPAVPMPLYKYLAFLAEKGKLRAFILYFGHKEKEWISLEMHRMLTEGKWRWRHVWSLLIGDERFVVCFGPTGIGIPDCEGLLASAVKNGLSRYTDNRDWFKVAIYDTFYREIKC